MVKCLIIDLSLNISVTCPGFSLVFSAHELQNCIWGLLLPVCTVPTKSVLCGHHLLGPTQRVRLSAASCDYLSQVLSMGDKRLYMAASNFIICFNGNGANSVTTLACFHNLVNC